MIGILFKNAEYMKTVKSDRDKEIISNPLGENTFQRIKGALGQASAPSNGKSLDHSARKLGRTLRTHPKSTKCLLMPGRMFTKVIQHHIKILSQRSKRNTGAFFLYPKDQW